MKRFLAVFLMLAILLTGLTVTANAATAGWKKDGDVWTYVKADGTLAENEWIKDGGKWYYFIGTAMAQDQVFQDNKGKCYAADATGAMISNLWFNETGTDEEGNTWSDWYYAGANGELVKGWNKIDGKWYYFFGTQKSDKDWVWPAMMTGLYVADWTEAGPVSWFDSGKFYAFKPNGEMIVGWGQPWKGDSGWVYGNADGSLVTSSWKKIGGKWYYFDQVGWMYQNGIGAFTNGKPSDWNEKATLYAFSKSGDMVENGWYKDEYTWEDEDGNIVTGYDWYYAGKDGALKKGWIKDGGKWYYLDADWAYMWSDRKEEMSDGKTYGFKKNGEMVIGWYQFDDVWYYFKADGSMATKEWVKSGNAWYYLKADGEMAKDEILTIDGKPYKFDANGVWVP